MNKRYLTVGSVFVVAVALWGLNTLSQNSSSSPENTRKPVEKVYAAIEGEGAIAVIDGESNKVVTKIDLTDSKSGKKYSPHNVQVSPDGKAVWVTANAEMKTHNHSLRIIKPAYASAKHQDKYKDTGITSDLVIAIAPKTDTIVHRIPIATGQHLAHVVQSRDNSKIFVTAQATDRVYVIDTNDLSIEKSITLPVGSGPHGMRT